MYTRRGLSVVQSGGASNDDRQPDFRRAWLQG